MSEKREMNSTEIENLFAEIIELAEENQQKQGTKANANKETVSESTKSILECTSASNSVNIGNTLDDSKPDDTPNN